jgi:hypothetical protein
MSSKKVEGSFCPETANSMQNEMGRNLCVNLHV